jgi:S-adenosylmethionine decarboxylase
MPPVGTEWLIDASGCDAKALGDIDSLRAVFARAIDELGLHPIGEAQWHKFPEPGGVTGLVMLTESHLACHTYPEFGIASFNLYCCRERPSWPWRERLAEMIDATSVHISLVQRNVAALDQPANSKDESGSPRFAAAGKGEA